MLTEECVIIVDLFYFKLMNISLLTYYVLLMYVQTCIEINKNKYKLKLGILKLVWLLYT